MYVWTAFVYGLLYICIILLTLYTNIAICNDIRSKICGAKRVRTSYSRINAAFYKNISSYLLVSAIDVWCVQLMATEPSYSHLETSKLPNFGDFSHFSIWTVFRDLNFLPFDQNHLSGTRIATERRMFFMQNSGLFTSILRYDTNDTSSRQFACPLTQSQNGLIYLHKFYVKRHRYGTYEYKRNILDSVLRAATCSGNVIHMYTAYMRLLDMRLICDI